MNLISLLFASIITNNVVLTKFLGICPFIGTSNKKKQALYMGLSVMGVVLISNILIYLVYNFILIPTNTTYLRTLTFILIIASIVQILDIILKKFPKVHKELGSYLPLITTNCAVLGTILISVNRDYNFLETVIFSIGSSLGFLIVIYVFSSIRERLEISNIPKCFKGYPIALIVASIMALLFTRYIPI